MSSGGGGGGGGGKDTTGLGTLKSVTSSPGTSSSKKKKSSSKSGAPMNFRGVREASNGRWQARISIGGKIKDLGLFDTPTSCAPLRHRGEAVGTSPQLSRGRILADEL